MRLTLSLFRMKKIGGNIFTGKHRLYPTPRPEQIAYVVRDLNIEEQNLFYLRHPYVNLKEAYAEEDLEALNRTKNTELQLKALSELKPDVSIEEHYDALSVTNVWD